MKYQTSALVFKKRIKLFSHSKKLIQYQILHITRFRKWNILGF